MLAKIFENIRIASTAVLANKLRAALTIIGITIGISSVVVLVSIGQAFEDFVVEQFNSFGTNYIMIFGGENREIVARPADSGGPPEAPMDLLIPLTQRDYEAIADFSNVPDALYVSRTLMVMADVKYEDREVDMPQVVGTDTEYFQTIDLAIELGRGFVEDDITDARRVALLGVNVVDELFPNIYPVGEAIRVGGVRFEVIGVLEEIPGGAAAEQDNTSVIIPVSTAQRRLSNQQTHDGEYPITTLMVQARSPETVATAVEQIRETLRETHNIETGEEDDFIIFSQNQMLDTLETITRLLTYFLAAIAAISLLVGGIGVMNIMLVTVIERTHEIGLRKAVGARQSDILLQFLVESAFLSMLGGAIGTGMALTGAWLATTFIPDLTVTVEPISIVFAVVISLSIGLFFGAYPASRAAKLSPIDALRYE